MIKIIDGNLLDAKTDIIAHQVNCQGAFNSGVAKAIREFDECIYNDWVLMIFPRSSLGFKYRLQLDNTVGVIDADYYYSDNEGHIFIKITNDGDQVLRIHKGEAFAQGIFFEYGVTEDDHVEEQRNGGMGSTDKDKKE